MTEKKQSTNKEAEAAAKKEEEISVEELSPQVRQELALLGNIGKFLKQVDGIKGEEALAFVMCQQYVNERYNMLKGAEVSRIKATKTKSSKAAKKK